MDAIPSIDAQVSVRLSKSFFTGVNEKKKKIYKTRANSRN